MSSGSPWTERQAWDWQQSHGWLCGFNYVPSTAVNALEMWQEETFDPITIDRELGWAQALGFNTCRIYLPFILWQHDANSLLQRVERFLEIADAHGHVCAVVLFDDCISVDYDPFLGDQGPPIPGVHNSRWIPSPGHRHVVDRTQWPAFERYVTSVVTRFAQDDRIAIWDLYNEPGQSGLGDQTLPLLRETFRWARAVSPKQPLTSGIYSGPPPHLGETAEVNAVTRPAAALDDFMLSESDVISFHDYGDLEHLKEQIATLKTFGRPVICTEWLCRIYGSRVETHLSALQQENVGCYFWGLVNGKTQTQFPWGSPQGAPEPDLWFHDLLRIDGTPYNASEVMTIKAILFRSALCT